MSLETVERIAHLFTKGGTETVLWIWHGGEPLLMSDEFYGEAYKILQKYNIDHVSMQSNGSLLTRSKLDWLKKFNWNISFSFDGIDHDVTRESSKSVLLNILLHNIERGPASVIMVVDGNNVKNLSANYEFFKSKGIRSFQFNRVFDAEGATLLDSKMDEYFQEYATLLDKWINDSEPLNVRNFNEVITYILGLGDCYCNMRGGCLYEWASVNPVGDVYPCDRYYPKEFIYGNVWDFSTVEDIFESEVHKKLSRNAEERLKYCRDTCDFVDFCNGGCNNTAVLVSGGTRPSELECRLFKGEMTHLFNVLKDLDPAKVKNPMLRRTLIQSGYRSLSFLREVSTVE